jgi:hypothetical protein
MKLFTKASVILATLMINSSALAFAISEVHIINYGNIPRNTAFEPVAKFRYGIRNDTNINQEYVVRYSICADNKGCVNGERRIPISPSRSIDDGVDLPMSLTYYNSGTYNIAAYITIDGESFSRNEAHVRVNVY